MIKAISVRSSGILAAALALAGAASAHHPRHVSADGALVVAGSGSNLPAIRLLADAFQRRYPGVRIEVPPGIGSTGAVRAVADGAIALGLISRPLRPEEQRLGLVVVPYARTAVVLAVHPTVTADGLTYRDLVEIYGGTRRRWPDGREIVVLTREPGDSSIEVLEREVPGFREVYAASHRARRWTVLVTDQAMNRALVQTPYALGLSDAGAVATERLAVRALRINGVAPTPGAVAGGRYRLVKTLAFVFLPGRLAAEADAFMDFVRSPEGEALLRAGGYLPPE
jgi:phosphate transport system substrate-binding protein